MPSGLSRLDFGVGEGYKQQDVSRQHGTGERGSAEQVSTAR